MEEFWEKLLLESFLNHRKRINSYLNFWPMGLEKIIWNDMCKGLYYEGQFN